MNENSDVHAIVFRALRYTFINFAIKNYSLIKDAGYIKDESNEKIFRVRYAKHFCIYAYFILFPFYRKSFGPNAPDISGCGSG